MLNAVSCLARVASREKLTEQVKCVPAISVSSCDYLLFDFQNDRPLSSAVNIIRRFPQEKNAGEGLALTLESLANKSKGTLEGQLDIWMDVIFAQVNCGRRDRYHRDSSLTTSACCCRRAGRQITQNLTVLSRITSFFDVSQPCT